MIETRMLKAVTLMSRISGLHTALMPAHATASTPSEASEGNKHSQPLNNTRRPQEVMLTLTEESTLGRIVDQLT